MAHIHNLLILATIFSQIHTKMLRNDALISKMVSNFKDNTVHVQPGQEKSKDVVAVMQNVLCRNFPAVPCHIITQDQKLKKLIKKSIQQIKHKTHLIETTPASVFGLTLFPVVNSEDLSGYLHVSDTGYITREKNHQREFPTNLRLNERHKNSQTKVEKTKFSVYGTKKMRKFYPHKIKYKDKAAKKELDYNSEEKLSMSVEVPDLHMGKNLDYRQSADPPVWRIDYTKHGEPGLNNMFGIESDRLRKRLAKTGPNVIVEDNIVEQNPRKDVMHPDVYIRKSFIRKNDDSGELV